MQLHRQAAEERLANNNMGQSFLARQRQVHSRRAQTINTLHAGNANRWSCRFLRPQTLLCCTRYTLLPPVHAPSCVADLCPRLLFAAHSVVLQYSSLLIFFFFNNLKLHTCCILFPPSFSWMYRFFRGKSLREIDQYCNYYYYYYYHNFFVLIFVRVLIIQKILGGRGLGGVFCIFFDVIHWLIFILLIFNVDRSFKQFFSFIFFSFYRFVKHCAGMNTPVSLFN